MKVILNAFYKRPVLCLLRNEMCFLVIIYEVCNSEGNKECPGKVLYFVLRTSDQKLGWRKEGLLEFKQSSSNWNYSSLLWRWTAVSINSLLFSTSSWLSLNNKQSRVICGIENLEISSWNEYLFLQTILYLSLPHNDILLLVHQVHSFFKEDYFLEQF